MARTTQHIPLTLMLPVGAVEAYALAALDGSQPALAERLSRAIARVGQRARADHASLARLRVQALSTNAGPAVAFRLHLPAPVATALLTLAAAADLGVSDIATTWLLQGQAQEARFRSQGAGQGHGRMAADPYRP